MPERNLNSIVGLSGAPMGAMACAVLSFMDGTPHPGATWVDPSLPYQRDIGQRRERRKTRGVAPNPIKWRCPLKPRQGRALGTLHFWFFLGGGRPGPRKVRVGHLPGRTNGWIAKARLCWGSMGAT